MLIVAGKMHGRVLRESYEIKKCEEGGTEGKKGAVLTCQLCQMYQRHEHRCITEIKNTCRGN